jgi:hypothetical protein
MEIKVNPTLGLVGLVRRLGLFVSIVTSDKFRGAVQIDGILIEESHPRGRYNSHNAYPVKIIPIRICEEFQYPLTENSVLDRKGFSPNARQDCAYRLFKIRNTLETLLEFAVAVFYLFFQFLGPISENRNGVLKFLDLLF